MFDTILVSFFNLIQAGTIWEQATLIKKMALSQWPVGKSVLEFSWLIITVEGSTPLWAVSNLD